MVGLSDFSMVGYPIDLQNKQAMVQEVQKYSQSCEQKQISQTDIVCAIRDPSGAELWIGLQRDANGQLSISTLNPAFSGSGRTEVVVDRDSSNPEEKPFETIISAHFSGEATPIVFEISNPAQASLFAPGTKLTVNISAFSFEPKIYANSEAYIEAQPKTDKGIVFADNYFVPSGMFFEKAGGAMQDGASRPSAYADFAGTVVKSELRNNRTGPGQFWWALVKTYQGNTIDVVMDPSTVKLEPKIGTILSGRFWMAARPASP